MNRPQPASRQAFRPGRRWPGRCAAVLLILCELAMASAGAAVSERILCLDGSTLTGPIEALDTQGRLSLAGGRTARLEDVLAIERNGIQARAETAAMRVHLIDGSQLQAANLSVADRRVQVTWRDGQTLVLPLTALRAVVPVRAEGAEAIAAAVAKAPAQEDQVLALSGDNTQAIAGTLVGMDVEGATITWQGKDRRLAWARIAAVTLGLVGTVPERRGRVRIDLVDRSSLWAWIEGLQAGRLRLRLVGDLAVDLPWGEVLRLEQISTRLVYCSDLEPVEVEAGSWVGTGGHGRDRNALDGPLVLAGKTHLKGLGTKAPCRLVFACPANASHFAAIVGLDDAAGKQGDCLLRVLADGKELASQRVRAGDKPVALRVALAGARRLELRADPGENLDLGDHADWCDARFDLTGTGR